MGETLGSLEDCIDAIMDSKRVEIFLILDFRIVELVFPMVDFSILF